MSADLTRFLHRFCISLGGIYDELTALDDLLPCFSFVPPQSVETALSYPPHVAFGVIEDWLDEAQTAGLLSQEEANSLESRIYSRFRR